MKINKLMVLLAILSISSTTYGQFLDNLGKKAERAVERTVERRVERETEKSTDRALDSVVEAPKKEKKKKKKKNKKKEKNKNVIGNDSIEGIARNSTPRSQLYLYSVSANARNKETLYY